MSVTLAVRFPVGRYHATPWDRSANEGTVEWPPSPWRILRALVATWYTRWPDLPAPTLDAVLSALGNPPVYWTPPANPGHTRHYLPDTDHTRSTTGSTDLTLDAFLTVARDADLFVHWNTTLNAEQRDILAKLAELVPYLGRAESVCQIRLLDPEGQPAPDDTWWHPAPGSDGAESIRLLVANQPIRRAVLETSPTDVRRARRTTPPDTTLLTYTRTTPAAAARTQPSTSRVSTASVNAIRFAVLSQTPIKSTHGVLLADELHRHVTRRLDGTPAPLLGTGGAATNHQHAHWIPIADSPNSGATITAIIIWAPAGIPIDAVTRIIGIRSLTGQRGSTYRIKGLPDTELLLQAVGTLEHIAPELTTPTRHWRSLTPYLPVRYRKREPLDDYLTKDITAELRYRNLPPATVTLLNPASGLSDQWARAFRRYRLTEHLGKARPGLGLHLEFPEPINGPLLLGQLSHFGYGIFTPELEQPSSTPR
ncbi:type I-U CRISPR-associated protein Csb2 [Dactylosporangium sp. NPDC051485]|uniref:type I-G CRISPR-associated protein Csb2 n=1 Tax=Dactylosporangium sp. NPDC051485 TaxID=3154846 RepID=UPI00344A4CA6